MSIIKPYVKKQLYVALCVYLGQMVLCFSMSWPASSMFGEAENTPLPQVFTSTHWTVIEVIYYTSNVIGACTFGFLSNYAGRKPCFFISGFFSFCAFTILATAKSIGVFYLGILLIGLGSGITHVAIIVYLGEIASTNIRGLMLTSASIFMFVHSWIEIIMDSWKVSYLVLSYLGSAVSAAFIMAVFFIPESPVFLTMKGSNEHLERTLIALGRENELPTMLTAKSELTALKKTQVDNWFEIATMKSNRKAIFITLTLNILQGLSGSMGVIYFIPKFIDPNPVISLKILIVIFQACSSAGALCSLFLVEKVGRKTLLMISTGSCGISLGILSSYFMVDMWFPEHNGYVWVYLIILTNYFFSYSLGFRIIPETLIGEMFTPNVRSTGSATVIFMSTLIGYAIILLSNLILSIITINIGLLFVTYCITNIFSFIFTLFLVPETKGLTFIEINELMSKQKLIRFN